MHALLALALLGLAAEGLAGPAAQPAASQPADVRFGPLPDTNTDFKPARYGSLDEWKKRRDWLRMQVRVAAGLWPEPEKFPLNARIFGKIEGDGYTIEKVYFESYPGLYVTGNVYRHVRPPQGVAATDASGRSNRQDAGSTSKYPGVLCPHGHWKNGRLEQSELGNIPARCIMLARMGCTVFAYDMVGYNDSARQFDHRKINTPALDLWGITSMHLQTWNSIRAIDFLQSLPEVDPERIGVTGASGGGTQTFMIAAVDDRVKVTCPVNMISHTMQGGCSCENAPCLRVDTNNMEIGALFAPKPMLMVSASGDWTKDTPKVEYPFIKRIYELYGKAENVENAHFDAPHNYNQQSREAMYRFFATHLLGWPDEKANAIKEHDIPTYKPEELLVWAQNDGPTSPDQEEILKSIRRTVSEHALSVLTASQSSEGAAPGEIVRAGLEQMIGSDFTVSRHLPAVSITTNQVNQWTRNGRTATVLPFSAGLPALPNRLFWLDSRGMARAHESKGERRLPSPGLFIWFIEPFTPNSTFVEQQRRAFFSTFNRALAAETVHDVLTVLSGFQRPHPDISAWNGLVGGDRFGPVTLVARAILSDDVIRTSNLRTVIDMNRFDIDSDEAYLKELNIPHIRRIGGLRAIAAVACNGPIWFHSVGDHFDEAFVKAAGRANGVEVRVTKEKASDAEVAAWLLQP